MARLEAWIDWALGASAVAWFLGALSAAQALAVALDPGWMHDEGLLTYGYARGMAQAPLAFAFFQKSKPLLAAFYAVPASFGLLPFLVVHALVTALAVPLAAAAARALGARRPNVAAVFIALSPFFLRSGGTGLSNADAVVVGLLVILLAARGHLLTAGLVAGASIWVRYESGILAVTFFIAAITTPSLRRMAIGLAVFPTLYLAAGALYHADALWVAHWPPSITDPVAALGHLTPYAHHNPATLVRALLSVSPAVVVLAIVPFQRLSALERTLFIFVALFVLAFGATHVAVLPIGPFFVLGYSERYAIAVLPALAVLAARAAEPAAPGEPGWRGSLGACLGLIVCGVFVRFAYSERALLLALVAPTLALAFAASRARTLAPWPLLILALAGPMTAAPWLDQGGFRSRREELRQMVALLDQHAPDRTGTIYTSSELLRAYLARTRDPRSRHITYFVQPGQTFELDVLTSSRHGQRPAVRALLLEAVFGPVVAVGRLSPATVRPADRFLVQDAHGKDALPAATWGASLQSLGRLRESHWTLYRMRDALRESPSAP